MFSKINNTLKLDRIFICATILLSGYWQGYICLTSIVNSLNKYSMNTAQDIVLIETVYISCMCATQTWCVTNPNITLWIRVHDAVYLLLYIKWVFECSGEQSQDFLLGFACTLPPPACILHCLSRVYNTGAQQYVTDSLCIMRVENIFLAKHSEYFLCFATATLGFCCSSRVITQVPSNM